MMQRVGWHHKFTMGIFYSKMLHFKELSLPIGVIS